MSRPFSGPYCISALMSCDCFYRHVIIYMLYNVCVELKTVESELNTQANNVDMKNRKCDWLDYIVGNTTPAFFR